MMQEAIAIYTEVITYALPFAIAFEVGNLMVGIFMRAAFGGRLWFGSR